MSIVKSWGIAGNCSFQSQRRKRKPKLANRNFNVARWRTVSFMLCCRWIASSAWASRYKARGEIEGKGNGKWRIVFFLFPVYLFFLRIPFAGLFSWSRELASCNIMSLSNCRSIVLEKGLSTLFLTLTGINYFDLWNDSARQGRNWLSKQHLK